MLVVSVATGERVFVGDDIEVMLVRMGNGKIRLGVKAPENVKILREKLLEAGDPRLGQTGRCGGDQSKDDDAKS